jgi:hypothetical protein
MEEILVILTQYRDGEFKISRVQIVEMIIYPSIMEEHQ